MLTGGCVVIEAKTGAREMIVSGPWHNNGKDVVLYKLTRRSLFTTIVLRAFSITKFDGNGGSAISGEILSYPVVTYR